MFFSKARFKANIEFEVLKRTVNQQAEVLRLQGLLDAEKDRGVWLRERGDKYASALANMEAVIAKNAAAVLDLASKAVEKVPTKINNTNKQ